MNERANPSVAFSHMSVTAAISVLALLVLIAWQLVAHFAPAPQPLATASQSTTGSGIPSQQQSLAALASTTDLLASSSDPVSQASTGAMAQILGAYAGMQSNGGYNAAEGTQYALSVGTSLSAPVPYHKFTLADVTTDSSTSYQRMLKYRSDLQAALQPLMANKQSELTLFAKYVQTKDPSYLAQLTTASDNYFAAASSTALVVAPADAAQVQLGLLNAMEQFGATVQAMVAHANDPLAAAVLLDDYNKAESDMLSAFNALISYEKSKRP